MCRQGFLDCRCIARVFLAAIPICKKNTCGFDDDHADDDDDDDDDSLNKLRGKVFISLFLTNRNLYH